MNKQERERFLAEIAEDVDRMLCGTVSRNNKSTEVDASRVRTRFRAQSDTFAEKYRVYIEAKDKAETKKNQHDVQLPPDPTNPKDWSSCGLLPCYYAVLAVIYNRMKSGTVEPVEGRGWSRQRKLSDLLTKSGDNTYVFLSIMRPCIQNFWGGFSERVIKTSLRHVKKDILHNCKLREPSETEQDIAPSKDKKKKAKIACLFKKIIGWIFKKTSHVIGAVIIAIIVVILVDIFADFGWIERIKAVIYKILQLN